MVFRRIIAGFFVFLFIVAALPTFLIYSLSRNLFAGSFYKGPIFETTYPYFIQVSASHLYYSNEVITKYFDEKTIKDEIEKVLSPEIFRTITSQVGEQIEKLKKKPEEPGTIDLKIIRESLLTVTHNLAYKLFENIPLCTSRQLPEVNTEGIPTCISPQNTDYLSISAPLSKEFEKAVYGLFPEQLQIDLHTMEGQNTSFYYVFRFIDSIRLYLLITLAMLMAIIALILYQPVALMLYYEGIAFAFAGFGGIAMGISIEALSSFFIQNINNSSFTKWLEDKVNENPETVVTLKQGFAHFINSIISFIIDDIQKISLAFLVMGMILFFIHFFLKKKPFFQK